MCGRGVLNSYYNIFIVKRRGEKNKKKTAGLANCAFSTKKIILQKIFVKSIHVLLCICYNVFMFHETC